MVVVGSHQPLFVIPKKCNYLCLAGFLEVQYPLDALLAVSAAVNVITQENDRVAGAYLPSD